MRYGLCHIIVTDPYYKFKYQCNGKTVPLKIQYQMCARDHQDINLLESFNCFLNNVLTVFGNARMSNMDFIERSFTSYYAWDSSQVATADLSRSLVVTRREYHLPIKFQRKSYTN